MPEKFERCVKAVKLKIKKGELPKGSSPFAICTSALRPKKKRKKKK